MTEEQVLNAIADACEDNTLRFQIIIQDEVLHVYINRPTSAELDYQHLKSKIYDVVTKTFLEEFSTVWLYCRVLGEIEADWQAVLEITSKGLDPAQMSGMMQSITDAVEKTHSVVDKIERELVIQESFANDPVEDALWDFEDLPTTANDNSSEFGAELDSEFDLELLESIDKVSLELDYKQYCFIDNQQLLYSAINAPQENIARLVDTFDHFERSLKRSQLPDLEIFFQQSIYPNLDTLTPEMQLWWTEVIALEPLQQYQLATWLSRYCLHPEQTISSISKVFTPQVKGNSRLLQQANNSIKPKLSQQVAAQNQNSPKTKSGLFLSWIIWLHKFLGKNKSK